ncbi:hypothetical protein [Brevundimonas subvibrioides]|uniref:Uncharacterized protein n=1 Tax=Brevundimonas subvibrioides (strain ATCC 15264 / DSM 4735 / LMG 14903 / NBRC 16000 / CB 81) TaxID=633149 RepID=D9QM45_BRESC|nr:hypothetical protein [Brevundimonas subvibrioides]ADL01971.1 hypothetical protein Bresu_2664 [Brevundimonas subvibrioides ATCC 15264]
MGLFSSRGASALAALAIAATLASCASNKAAEEAEATRVAAEVAAAAALAAQPKPIALNDSVIQSAAIYLGFTRDMATLRGGFESPEAILAAMQRGAAYQPDQISRGLVAYASILALQSPEFLTGVRQYGTDRETRNQTVARIVADPTYASTLPGADAAAGLIMGVLDADIAALRTAADSIENDAYAIQADGRASWARQPVPDREARIQGVKDLSARRMVANAEDVARLSAAASSGSGLGVSTPRLRQPPYPPAVSSALALAALAVLDGAGENAVSNTDALQYDRASQDCFASSKLNLFQCLAASRPSYEVEFCLGRHVVRDLATCARGTSQPAGQITVGAPTQSRSQPATPVIRTEPIQPSTPLPVSPAPATPATVTPVVPPAPSITPNPALAPGASPTQRLNAAPPAPQR